MKLGARTVLAAFSHSTSSCPGNSKGHVIPREPVDYNHYTNVLGDYRRTPLLMTLRDIDGHLSYFKHLDPTSLKIAPLIRSAYLRIEKLRVC